MNRVQTAIKTDFTGLRHHWNDEFIKLFRYKYKYTGAKKCNTGNIK